MNSPWNMGNMSLKVLGNSLNFLFKNGYEPCTRHTPPTGRFWRRTQKIKTFCNVCWFMLVFCCWCSWWDHDSFAGCWRKRNCLYCMWCTHQPHDRWRNKTQVKTRRWNKKVSMIICPNYFRNITLVTAVRAVTTISSCQVNTTSRWGIKQLGISFGSIFLLFSYGSSRGLYSWKPEEIPGPRP